jgi:hypothetical protein
MKREDIRSFVARPRADVERLKRKHWALVAQTERRESVPLGHLLLEHARATDPSFPPARYVSEDWEHHLRLKRLVDRAAAAFSRR